MKKTISLITFIILFCSSQTFACDCPDNKLEEVVHSTEVIIIGKFISTKNNSFPLFPGENETDRLFYEGSIIITEILSGNKFNIGDTLSVKSNYSNCSSFYKNRGEYIFFATKKEDGIISDACSFTHQITNKTVDDIYLRTLEELKK